jgi:hypothetical protein
MGEGCLRTAHGVLFVCKEICICEYEYVRKCVHHRHR